MAPGLLLSEPQSDMHDRLNEDQGSTKPTVYMLDKLHSEATKHAQCLFNVVLPSDPELQNWQQNAEFILMKSSSLSAEEINKAQRLRAIGKQGVGIDRIDAKACQSRGIDIINTPGVNATAVAELVLALTMSVAREIASVHGRLVQDQQVGKESCSGLIMTGKTIGLVGMGNIGKAVARIFKGAFNAKIVAYDPYMPASAWGELPHVRASTVAEVIETADVLSVHVPLTPSTRDLVGYKQMLNMKPTAIIINAARGGIVNELDLARAVKEGVIWGAGLDCHEEEPPTKARYEALWSSGRIVSTPHIGAATAQTQMETAKAAVDLLYDHISKSR
ncbi:hypothetical protein LTR62_006778 [Meristemomyces frigidus]|uniref:D-3-phosphoglycerate dehydrogenase n=1 Tax=Meristemomyces frigidus TaxID=1508187 RepID=A0AAN7YE92_9PEZI|nr:hypothetical protein LTR62_006778 [Meristemomyces frigidus]